MKEKDQLDFYPSLARKVRPDSNRTAPKLWFQHVAILRKLDPANEYEVRRVQLYRGLNILWAPPESATAEVKMYEDGISGHASGKTLFCRLLRYLLGEQNYGNETMVKSVGEKFPELWVLGEVFVADQLWLVARPMTDGPHKFAVKGMTIDAYLRDKPARGDFADYLKALEEVACGELSGREEANELFGWRYLLPWLARDQECRFASLTDWRSSLSGAERPQTSVADQQLLIRAVLGVLKHEEQQLKARLETTEEDLKEDQGALPEAERRWQRDWQHWSGQLKRLNIEVEPPESAVALDDIETRVSKFSEGVQEAIRIANEDEALKASETDWQGKRDARIRLEALVTPLETDIKKFDAKHKELSSKRQTVAQQAVKNPKRLEDGFCPNTLTEAIRRGCVAPPPGAPLETEMAMGEIQSESDVFGRLLVEKRTELARIQSDIERQEAVINTAWAKFQAEQKRVNDGTKGLRRKQQDADSASERFEAVKDSFEAMQAIRESSKSNTWLREQLKQNLERHLKEHTPTEHYTSDLFADVVRAVMGNQIKAYASLTDRGITLKAERNGDLHGAALETIKILAFDIAALATSIEGKGHHPRFLIHDGPRESDMSRVIYERFFLYAKKLEESIGSKGAASFQYIVTTTTPPPKDMQRGSPWLLAPLLDGAKKSGKLLKEDL